MRYFKKAANNFAAFFVVDVSSFTNFVAKYLLWGYLVFLIRTKKKL